MKHGVISLHRLSTPWAQRYRESGEWPGVPLAASFERTCVRLPESIALVDGANTLSFAELAKRVRSLAAGLEALGVVPGDAVAYQLPNWWEAAATLLATVSLGASSVPIVPMFRAREVGFILAQTRPRVVVVAESHRGADHVARVREGLSMSGLSSTHVVVVRAAGETPAGTLEFARVCAPPSDRPAADPSSLAVVIYTSGSTAEPKGAMHTHDTLTAELRSLAGVHDLGPADRVLMPSPLTHVSGVVHGILAPALLGTSAVLTDRWEPGAALEAIERHGVTYMIGAPTFLQEMLAHPRLARHDLSSLRLFSCGGASVPPELMRLGRERLPGLVTKRVYGSSEFPTIATTSAADALARGLDTEGRPLPGVELRICDEAGGELPAGWEGEIRARGPDCFLGYVDAALDAESFDADGFFRTGDLGVVDGEGYLRVTGRVKEIIVRKGEKISAREVEDLLATHPDLAEVAVIPVSDAETGERACACVRTVPGASVPTLQTMVDFLRANDLTTQKLPERLVVLESFPRTPSGKIHKRQLRDQIERGSS